MASIQASELQASAKVFGTYSTSAEHTKSSYLVFDFLILCGLVETLTVGAGISKDGELEEMLKVAGVEEVENCEDKDLTGMLTIGSPRGMTGRGI